MQGKEGPPEGRVGKLTNHSPSPRDGALNAVSRETMAKFEAYEALLFQWQKRINLVSASTLADVKNRHFADGIELYSIMPGPRHWIDLGSGAGFPGLVIAIMMQAEGHSGRIDLIEANNKKCAFMNTIIREVGLREDGMTIQVHGGRIERVLPGLPVPDAISARALAPLGKLINLTRPVIGLGARGLFLKGEAYRQELAEVETDPTLALTIHHSKVSQGSAIVEVTRVQ